MSAVDNGVPLRETREVDTSANGLGVFGNARDNILFRHFPLKAIGTPDTWFTLFRSIP